jgi:hypothetical protein
MPDMMGIVEFEPRPFDTTERAFKRDDWLTVNFMVALSLLVVLLYISRTIVIIRSVNKLITGVCAGRRDSLSTWEATGFSYVPTVENMLRKLSTFRADFSSSLSDLFTTYVDKPSVTRCP